MKKKNVPIILVAIAAGTFLLIYLGITITGNFGSSSKEVGVDKALNKLEKMVKKIRATEVSARMSSLDLGKNNLEDELPEITKYPLTVTGTTNANIEIFASPEKSGEGYDGWLNEVATEFNQKGIQVNGETASVSIRNIASGLGIDYIISGKYRPDVFAPSNEMWGAMVLSEGVSIQLEQKRLVGNVAGILLTKQKKAELEGKYGEINIKSITQATADNAIAMGYTNPYASSTGLNFLISTLHAYDQTDPLSTQAIEGFTNFQKNVPFVAYTTMQMRDAANSGVLDGMILEYQTYSNVKDLKDYTFNPFGARHDNPVYSVGELTEQKKAVLAEFLKFCGEGENQQLAKQYGFNELDSYQSDIPDYTGDVLLSAQGLWKERKDSGRPVTAVFIADVSGSMDGEPINELKRSLITGSKYISNENYVGLVSYDNDVYVNLPIAKFDANHQAMFKGAVEDLEAVGATATFDAIAVGANMLWEAKQANPDTKLMMFVLSDGETNTGYKLRDVEVVLKGLEIPVYTIGYNANIAELESISKINEAACINAESDDVVYKLKSLFNAQM